MMTADAPSPRVANSAPSGLKVSSLTPKSCAGIGSPIIVRLENGTRDHASYPNTVRLARALGVPVETLCPVPWPRGLRPVPAPDPAPDSAPAPASTTTEVAP